MSRLLSLEQFTRRAQAIAESGFVRDSPLPARSAKDLTESFELATREYLDPRAEAHARTSISVIFVGVVAVWFAWFSSGRLSVFTLLTFAIVCVITVTLHRTFRAEHIKVVADTRVRFLRHLELLVQARLTRVTQVMTEQPEAPNSELRGIATTLTTFLAELRA